MAGCEVDQEFGYEQGGDFFGAAGVEVNGRGVDCFETSDARA